MWHALSGARQCLPGSAPPVPMLVSGPGRRRCPPWPRRATAHSSWRCGNCFRGQVTAFRRCCVQLFATSFLRLQCGFRSFVDGLGDRGGQKVVGLFAGLSQATNAVPRNSTLRASRFGLATTGLPFDQRHWPAPLPILVGPPLAAFHFSIQRGDLCPVLAVIGFNCSLLILQPKPARLPPRRARKEPV